jgi:hypothetical protein
LEIQDVGAHEFDSLLLSLFGAYRRLPTKLPGRIYGGFACDLNYVNYPKPNLTGSIRIRDGYLDNIRFFVWLADFFSLPSLRKVDFDAISAQFAVTDNSAVLDKINLHGKQVSLTGVFDLKGSELVSSKISLSLPRELLEDSPKFRLLLALMSQETKSLSFDFRLSGLHNALNFQWMESEFKQKIKKMLPGFIERGLEKKIEKAVQSISQQ